jgi:hypothetical protein
MFAVSADWEGADVGIVGSFEFEPKSQCL